MGQFWEYVLKTLMYQTTGYYPLDAFIFYTSFYMEVAAAIVVLIIVLKNKTLRKRKRPIDKLVFRACALVFVQNVLDISLVFLLDIEAPWVIPVYDALLVINEVLYVAIILQWLICVDYSLHHSVGHIRRRYRHAALPVIFVAVIFSVSAIIVYNWAVNDFWYNVISRVLHTINFAVEICYILTAVGMVMRHDKERREPRFLRLSAFIIPFVLGVLVRFYDAPLLGFGIIFTYAAMSRRDKYIDYENDLYNSNFLDCISEYWDKKGFTDASAVLAAAPGHEKEMATILSNIRIPDCFIIKLGDDRFALLSQEVDKSALKIADDLLKNAAKEADPPFAVGTRAMTRTKGQTMKEYAGDIRREAFVLAPLKEGGDAVC